MTVIAISLSTPHVESEPQLQERFLRCAAFARHLPGGYVKKIVWDKAGGYPRHAWGYVQLSPRPFRQGYGCDGTTDENIHLIGIILCQRLGLDYAKIYRRAYAGEPGNPSEWIKRLESDAALRSETLIPNEAGRDELLLLLSDLNQINNRSLVAELEIRLAALGFAVHGWRKEEDRLHAWRRAIDQQVERS